MVQTRSNKIYSADNLPIKQKKIRVINRIPFSKKKVAVQTPPPPARDKNQQPPPLIRSSSLDDDDADKFYHEDAFVQSTYVACIKWPVKLPFY
jgi:hypothetical protein